MSKTKKQRKTANKLKTDKFKARMAAIGLFPATFIITKERKAEFKAIALSDKKLIEENYEYDERNEQN